MSEKNFKIRVSSSHSFPGSIKRICSSGTFWRGFADGLSSPKYVFYRSWIDDNTLNYLTESSVKEAWASVGELIGQALEEADANGEVPTQPAKPTSEQRQKRHPRASAG
jgi:hypothetical protein